MSDFERFVPNGCEFYQYKAAMADVWAPRGRESVLLHSVTVRRKSDGFFFGMSWHDGESAERAAVELAEDVRVTRMGGNRVDLGEANLGQKVRYSDHDPPGYGREIVAVDSKEKRYKRLGEEMWRNWSEARDP